MLPKTKLGKQMYRKLKVYAGDKHPHAAQKPVALKIKSGLAAAADRKAASKKASAKVTA